MRCFAILVFLLATGPAAIAHPGHGSHPSDGIQHYLASPMHAAPAGLVMAVVIGGILLIQRMRQQKRREARNSID